VFFRRRAKQLPLATNENVLGHVDCSRQMKNQTHVSTFLRAVCGSVPSLRLDKSFFNNISFPGDRCEVIVAGTCRNVITCAYLFFVSFRPRGVNSNTFLDKGNCFARLRENTLAVSVVSVRVTPRSGLARCCRSLSRFL